MSVLLINVGIINDVVKAEREREGGEGGLESGGRGNVACGRKERVVDECQRGCHQWEEKEGYSAGA